MKLEAPINTADFTDPRVKEIVWNFARFTLNQIFKNMARMKVSPHGTKYSGDLKKSIHSTVVNNAGGNGALVKFFYLNYGKFVEMAAGKGMPYHGPQDVEPISRPGFSPLNRTDGGPRKAKPLVNAEIRFHLRYALEKIRDLYFFATGIYWVNGFIMDDDKSRIENMRVIQELEKDFGFHV